MFAFRVLAMPRAGSTWVSNWLSSGLSICWHDPMEWASPEQIEDWARLQPRPAGISCTMGWLYADWKPQVPTILLDRPQAAVNASLAARGLPELPGWVFERWQRLTFPRVTLDDLFEVERARAVHALLLPTVPFDLARWQELKRMNVQPSEAELGRLRKIVADYNSRNVA